MPSFRSKHSFGFVTSKFNRSSSKEPETNRPASKGPDTNRRSSSISRLYSRDLQKKEPASPAPPLPSTTALLPRSSVDQLHKRSLDQDFSRPLQPTMYPTFGDAEESGPEVELSDDGDDTAAPPPDFSRRGIHVPLRTSSDNVHTRRNARPQTAAVDRYTGAADRSSGSTNDSRVKSMESAVDSAIAPDTPATSVHSLPALQNKGPPDEADPLTTVLEDDPRNFDLVAEATHNPNIFSVEKRAGLLISHEHLHNIFEDPRLLLKFSNFLSNYRPKSVPLLIYYLDALKALRAVAYANAVTEALEPIDGQQFTQDAVKSMVHAELEEKCDAAFDALVQDDLPAFVTHTWITLVSTSIKKRIVGTLPAHLREQSNGLAETFCLTDPSRADNPIVFASEEFHRTTQYGVDYAIGRNCRFLQGPSSDRSAITRLATAIREGREHSDIFVNYRRDGSAFFNLLMVAPLLDSRGTIRYFIGAQVDVSGLLKACSDLEGLKRIVEKAQQRADGEEPEEEQKDEFQAMAEMMNTTELNAVRKFGGKMHSESVPDDDERNSGAWTRAQQPRLLLQDPSPPFPDTGAGGNYGQGYMAVQRRANGRLEGVYQHYLLIRPYPSMRILFTSPSLRVPGILQSPFMSRVGGSSRVKDELCAALASGRGVTAKIRWIASPVRNQSSGRSGTRHDEDENDEEERRARQESRKHENEGRSRWIHCTPLIGHNGQIGVWMVVLVDDEHAMPSSRRFRDAPPVSSSIGNHDYTNTERPKDGRRYIPIRDPRPPTTTTADRPLPAQSRGREQQREYSEPAPERVRQRPTATASPAAGSRDRSGNEYPGHIMSQAARSKSNTPQNMDPSAFPPPRKHGSRQQSYGSPRPERAGSELSFAI